MLIVIVMVSMVSGVAQSFFNPFVWSIVEDTKNISTGNKVNVENTRPNANIVINVAKNSDSYLF